MRPWFAVLLLLLAMVMAAGCGFEGQPLAPLANVPGRVTGLSATERGSQLVVEFVPPQLTLEGFPIKSPLDLDVRVGPAPQPFDEDTWAGAARKLSGASIANGVATYEVPVTVWIGTDVTVGVRAIGQNRKESPWSFLMMVPIIAPPQPPSDFRVENTAGGVRLAWNSGGNPVRIYRKTGTSDFMAVAEVPQPPWTDSSTQFGQEYEYKIQTLVKLADNHEAESELTSEERITPKDIFPPATPSGVQVAAAPTSAELSWNGNTESDFASYHVYRSVDGGPYTQVADVQVPAYSDHDVQPGKLYRYQVSAVDRLGNESPRSAAVEVRLQ
jgi:hypothetical protein